MSPKEAATGAVIVPNWLSAVIAGMCVSLVLMGVKWSYQVSVSMERVSTEVRLIYEWREAITKRMDALERRDRRSND